MAYSCSYACWVESHRISELKIYIKLRVDLGMSEKTKKQVVSTQCLAYQIFVEICIPNSLVVWPVSTTNHSSQHACKILRHIYTLQEHVEWLAEDSAGVRHHIQIEHDDFNFAYSAHNQTIQFQVQFS